MSSETPQTLDPYSAKAQEHSFSPTEKISKLHKIVKACQTGMLTTRADDGNLHSRAMVPASPFTEAQANLVFIANNASQKFEEIKHDGHANVAFYDTKTTSWASYSGIAKVSRDPEMIKKYWSSAVGAYFGDLKDGVHKGDETDPRVSIIELVPEEVRIWVSTKSAAGRAVDITVSKLTHGTSVPGELITLTKSEIELTQGLHTKQ